MTAKQHFLVLAFVFAALIQSSRAYASPIYFAPAYSCTFAPGCHITMKDYGGPVMTGVTDVYTIFYGSPLPFYPPAAEEGFLADLTGGDYINLASLYGASTQINWKGGYIENEYLGNSLTDADLGTIVTDLTNGNVGTNATSTPFSPDASSLSPEANAIYFIFAAPGVNEQQDGDACSFHSDVGGLKFVWVGSYSALRGLCGQGSLYATMTAEASHELFETLTDPFVSEYYLPGETAWYSDGFNAGEIADPCNQEDFAVSLPGFPPGVVTFNVQSIFVNDPSYAAGGYCASGNTHDSAAAVPEPATLSLFGIGFASLVACRRKKRSPDVQGESAPLFSSQETGFENTFGLFGEFFCIQHSILNCMQ